MSYLGINNIGNLRPSTRSYDLRQNYFTESALSPSSAPMFYIGNRMNVLGSNEKGAYAVLKFGSNNMYNIYGNLGKKGSGNLLPVPKTSQTTVLTVNPTNGNYYLTTSFGKKYKVYFNSKGKYFNYKKNKMYF